MRLHLAPLLLAVACTKPVVSPPPVVDAGAPRPPAARRTPVSRTLHGETLVDEYAWMKEKGTPELEAHLAAENAYTEAMLAPHRALRAKLEQELRGRRPGVVDSFTTQHGTHLYWYRTDLARPFEQVLRRPLDGGPEQLVLDVGTLAPDASYVNLLDFEVSDDEARVAWAIDVEGAREFSLHVTELDGGARWPQAFPRATSFAWAADGRTLFFTTANEALRSHQLHRLDPGADAGVLVREEADERFDLTVMRTGSERFVALLSVSLTTNETALLDAKTPKGPLRVVQPRVQGQLGQAEERGRELVVLSRDQGREGRVYSVPLAAPREGKQVEWVPRREDVVLSTIEVTQTHLVVWERREGQLRPRALSWATRKWQDFEPQEGVFGLLPQLPGQPSRYRYEVSSPGLPATVFERDLAAGTTQRLWTQPVAGFEAGGLEVLRLSATAGDGTLIPITLARKKGVGPGAPLLLEAYGAYGDAFEVRFEQRMLPLLERGVVWAVAHVRGGGEFGERWHDAGKLQHKMNTFTDFIACAEHLVKEGHTTPGRLVITGGSAGGLLVGAALNLRPELFHAALAEVPFVDVLSTMLDPSLPLTLQEYEEWGDPRDPAQYGWIRAYSPYDNVKAQRYPNLLVRTAYNDTQVLFHEPAKWVQRLRALKTSEAPVLLWISMDPAGHGGRTNLQDVDRDEAKRLAWLLAQWGVSQ